MCLNDVSARDFQLATSQWLMGKTFDTFAPTGPWITTADEIDKNLGTRHRAAIGITEVTDAISIVVSEERGIISYAQHGQLHSKIGTDELKKVLRDVLS